MSTGETLYPKIPNAKYSDQNSARRSVLVYMQHGMLNDIFNALGDYTNENYVTYLNVRQHFITDDYPRV